MTRLYRLFPHVHGADPREEGGALWSARVQQGGGRHDNPAVYGALYLSRATESAVAEYLRRFLGRPFTEIPLEGPGGRRLALATFDDRDLEPLPDLDDARELMRRRLRPSDVATGERELTQALALRIHAQGSDGFWWWSTIEASWTNVTLFAERAGGRLRIVELEPLSLDDRVVRRAAERLGLAVA